MSYWTSRDTGDNVCINLQYCHYSIYFTHTCIYLDFTYLFSTGIIMDKPKFFVTRWLVLWRKFKCSIYVIKRFWAVNYTHGNYRPGMYRILWTIGRYIFPSTHWLRPIVHIDLYKDEIKIIWNP